MRPRSGVTSPAIMLTSVLLPAPEGPNRAVTPLAVAKYALTVNSPRRFSTSTLSTLLSVKAHAGPAGQPFGEHERHQRNRDRDQHQASGRRIAAGGLCESIDCGGNRLRFTWDVGDKRDSCAELAERLRKAEHAAGEQTRQRERQRYRRKNAQPVGAERCGGLLELLIDRLDGEPDRAHQQWKAHNAAGERGAGPAEREHDAEIVGQERADRSAPAKRNEQQIAGDDRRQHQRQGNDAVEQSLAPEILSRQQPRDGNTEWQSHGRCHQCDPQRQRNGGPFVGGEIEHVLTFARQSALDDHPTRLPRRDAGLLRERPIRKRRSGAVGARDGAPRVARYPSKAAPPWQSRAQGVYHLI